MRSISTIKRALAYQWGGPPDLPQSLKLEWRFVGIRWLGIIFITPGLFLANFSHEQLLKAYLVILFAAVYNLGVHWAIQRHPTLIASGYVTTLLDGLLNIALIMVGGGFGSPIYYILYTVTISAAMRFGYGPAIAMVLLYVIPDAATSLWSRQFVEAPFFFRSGFLFITAILAGYLREQAHRAESALHERLHQANLLDEVTASLTASLELDAVLNAVVTAAARVFGSSITTLMLSPEIDYATSQARDVICYPSSSDQKSRQELAAICRQYLTSPAKQANLQKLLSGERLSSGERVRVLRLSLPTHQSALAVLVLVAPLGQPMQLLDPDIVESFTERLTLAIENATLYQALTKRSTDLQRAFADLARAHQELLRVDEMKTNFLANVSHEFRTPLTSIRSFSELLLSYGPDDPTLQREFLDIINTESERLTRMVNDVLDITKIESGHFDWQMKTVDMANLIRETARAHATLFAKQNLSFQAEVCDALPVVHGDPDRLQQVVGNLLNNALKFTRSGTIRLAACCSGSEVVVSVTDTGIGISPKDHERIFEKFQQVGAVLTDKPRGAGLGLSICREIVEFHHGRIWVESEPGAGSKFSFTIPVSLSRPVPTQPPVRSVQELVQVGMAS
ncbi:MAG TPA: HAMP domain-containing sensor histidine kinase [Chloroflexota bacterium]|nr:HAMP domain-containing sensor histidine kinase [Chloroflexota bacterium]